jgi:glycosyltransferase involved in cell wall biosynthesis
MNILFIHQNCPGQYKHLAPHVAAVPGNKVAFITQPGKPNVNGVTKVEYKPTRQASPNTHRYIRNFEGFVLNGQGVARAAIQLKKAGFVPDVVCAHPSWGESLFIKDVYPDARLLLFCEFYYRAVGADVGFDPAYPVEIDDLCRVRVKNAAHMLSLESMDWGVSPTEWQRRQYPEWWRKQISLIHDGIDTEVAKPDPAASYTLPDGTVLRAGDEVVTYVARNLEPYRGFPTYMRALEDLCRRRPNARFIIVGGEDHKTGQADDAAVIFEVRKAPFHRFGRRRADLVNEFAQVVQDRLGKGGRPGDVGGVDAGCDGGYLCLVAASRRASLPGQVSCAVGAFALPPVTFPHGALLQHAASVGIVSDLRRTSMD